MTSLTLLQQVYVEYTQLAKCSRQRNRNGIIGLDVIIHLEGHLFYETIQIDVKLPWYNIGLAVVIRAIHHAGRVGMKK